MKKRDQLVFTALYRKQSRIFLHIPLHLHPNVRFTTLKIPHIPDSTSHAKLPER